MEQPRLPTNKKLTSDKLVFPKALQTHYIQKWCDPTYSLRRQPRHLQVWVAKWEKPVVILRWPDFLSAFFKSRIRGAAGVDNVHTDMLRQLSFFRISGRNVSCVSTGFGALRFLQDLLPKRVEHVTGTRFTKNQHA